MEHHKPAGCHTSDEELCKLFLYQPEFLDPYFDGKTDIKLFTENLVREIKEVTFSASNLNVASCYVTDDPSILNFACKNMMDYQHISKLISLINSEYDGHP